MRKGEAGEGMESIRQDSGPSRVVRGLERKFKRVGDTADSGRERSRARVSTFLNLRLRGPCSELARNDRSSSRRVQNAAARDKFVRKLTALFLCRPSRTRPGFR